MNIIFLKLHTLPNKSDWTIPSVCNYFGQWTPLKCERSLRITLILSFILGKDAASTSKFYEDVLESADPSKLKK